MKKLLCILTACVLLMALLTACDSLREIMGMNASTSDTAPPESTQPTEHPHVCQAGDILQMDRKNHWYTCQCGKRVAVEEHSLIDQVCSVCSATVSANAVQGLHYLWLTDAHDNVIRTQCYDWENNLLRTYTFEYTYSEDGKILGKVSYADQVIFASTTWDENGNILLENQYNAYGNRTKSYRHERTFDDNGVLLAMQTYLNGDLAYSYSLEPATLSAREIYYSEGSTTTHCYFYDQTGKLTQELRYKNDVLTHKLEYDVQFTRSYVRKEYLYDLFGNYTLQTYDYPDNLVGRQYFDAQGNPLDLSQRYGTAYTPILGSWSGEIVLDSSMVDMGLPNFQLKAQFYMHLDEAGIMTVIYSIDEAEYRQALISATTEMLWAQFGKERSQAELDTIFMSEYNTLFCDYVESSVDKQDLDDLIYKELRYVYFVEDGIFYSADSRKTPLEASPFTLEGDTLTFTDPNSSLSITMTRGGTAPVSPKADVEPDYRFDSEACSSLFGVWEGTVTESHISYPEITVEYVMRLTFRKDGTVLVQRFIDPQAYYDYILATRVARLYRQYEFSYSMTQQETDAYFAREWGVTVEAYAAAELSPLSEMIPKDSYTAYFFDSEGYLDFGHISTTVSVSDTVLTFIRHGYDALEYFHLKKLPGTQSTISF